MTTRRPAAPLAALLAGLLAAAFPRAAHAYIEAPYSLGMIVSLSTNITQLRVEKVDKACNLIVFRKVRDLKGERRGDVVKHNIARAGYNPREWRYVMDWAEVGKTAVMFDNGATCETCIGDYWCEAVLGGDWWHLVHGEPYLLRSYCGDADKLVALTADVLAAK